MRLVRSLLRVDTNRLLLLHSQRFVLDLSNLDLLLFLSVDRRQEVLNYVVLPVLHGAIPFALLRLQVDVLDVHPCVVTEIPKGYLRKFLSKQIFLSRDVQLRVLLHSLHRGLPAHRGARDVGLWLEQVLIWMEQLLFRLRMAGHRRGFAAVRG